MAVYDKKLHIRKAGVVTDINLYTTIEEVGGGEYITLKDGTTAVYARLGAIDDTYSSPLRVRKRGSIYSVLTQASLPYTELYWTTSGTYQWTVPNGVRRVRVVTIGSAGDIFCEAENGSGGTKNSGGPSSFNGGIVANGGTYGSFGGSFPRFLYPATFGTGGSPGGSTPYLVTGTGTVNKYGWLLDFTGTKSSTAVANCYGFNASGPADSASGGGGYNTGYVDVTPGQIVTIQVGINGKRVVNQIYDGAVLVAYGGSI